MNGPWFFPYYTGYGKQCNSHWPLCWVQPGLKLKSYLLLEAEMILDLYYLDFCHSQSKDVGFCLHGKQEIIWLNSWKQRTRLVLARKLLCQCVSSIAWTYIHICSKFTSTVLLNTPAQKIFFQTWENIIAAVRHRKSTNFWSLPWSSKACCCVLTLLGLHFS